MDLYKKIDQAIKLMQQADKAAAAIGQPVELCYSGGKDSDVILKLAQMAGINYRAIYKNTSIDPPGTIKHCKENGVEVLAPKKRFIEIIAETGHPSRFARTCCRFLKEYKVLDKAIVGIRRSESTKRAARYTEPTMCRYYGSKKDHVEQFLPILQWTDDDGTFHVERRLGCMCCPLMSINKRLEELKKHPNMVKLYAIGGARFLKSHPDSNAVQRFNNDVFAHLAFAIFCKSYQEFEEKFGKNLFSEGTDCKAYLEKYFNVDLSIEKYLKK